MELPLISKSQYGTSSLSGLTFGGDPRFGDGELLRRVHAINDGNGIDEQRLAKVFAAAPGAVDQRYTANLQQQIQEKVKSMSTARIVRVFIADPNENLPLERRVIYKSDEKLTDLTDQELFFEANPAALLAAHNDYRVTVVDRRTLGTPTVRNLEPARIRDLKMVVVDIAAF